MHNMLLIDIKHSSRNRGRKKGIERHLKPQIMFKSENESK
jgi:hypothetical protein